MKVGTRSVIFGAHQFLIHPLFVALAWRKLYGAWPHNRQIWAAIFLHDIGYIGLPNMDGREGQNHPLKGAVIVSKLFDKEGGERIHGLPYWFWFTATHSRYCARNLDATPSRLMRADKLATALMPLPLYMLLVLLSGEWREYVTKHQEYHHRGADTLGPSWIEFCWWALSIRAEWKKNYGPEGK